MTIENIREILKYCDLYELSAESFYENVVTHIHQDVLWEMGASKGVLIFPDEDYVVKIPFDGEDYEDYDGNLVISNFMFADDGETGNDYCLAELQKYDDIKLYNPTIAHLFAPTIFLGYCNERPIYIQKKCEVFMEHYEWDNEYENTKYISTTREICKTGSYDCFDERWLADVLECYGKKILKALLNAIEDLNITDLHRSNIGYLDDKPIIFDYSGFND